MIGIIGGHGFVGSAICGVLERQGVDFRALRRRDFDYTQTKVLERWMRDQSIEFLINAAGYTGKPNVDACELYKYECIQGNVVLPGVVQAACGEMGIPFGHISSGCIYTGQKPDGSGFDEIDVPNFSFRTNNCSFYSGCKALGEEVLADCESCYVWRLRIPFGEVDSPRNYISKILNYKYLLDARNSFSHLGQFASACVQFITNRPEFGIYNLTNGGSMTTREVSEMIRETIAPEREFEFFANENEFMQKAAIAPRSNCVLDNSKALLAGIHLSPIKDAFEMSLQNWQTQSVIP